MNGEPIPNAPGVIAADIAGIRPLEESVYKSDSTAPGVITEHGLEADYGKGETDSMFTAESFIRENVDINQAIAMDAIARNAERAATIAAIRAQARLARVSAEASTALVASAGELVGATIVAVPEAITKSVAWATGMVSGFIAKGTDKLGASWQRAGHINTHRLIAAESAIRNRDLALAAIDAASGQFGFQKKIARASDIVEGGDVGLPNIGVDIADAVVAAGIVKDAATIMDDDAGRVSVAEVETGATENAMAAARETGMDLSAKPGIRAKYETALPRAITRLGAGIKEVGAVVAGVSESALRSVEVISGAVGNSLGRLRIGLMAAVAGNVERVYAEYLETTRGIKSTQELKETAADNVQYVRKSLTPKTPTSPVVGE